jgi:hypothetical protein
VSARCLRIGFAKGAVAGEEGCVAVSVIAWVWVGAALWPVVAVLVALVVGRVVRSRDEQVPRPSVRQTGVDTAAPTEHADHPS